MHFNQKKTGCDEYGGDQLNVASKILAKYRLDDKDGKKYLKDFCSMKPNIDSKIQTILQDLRFVKKFTRLDFQAKNFTH